MNITLMGLEFSLKNLGCEALTLSFLTILKEELIEKGVAADDVRINAIVYRPAVSEAATFLFSNIHTINIKPKHKSFWKECKNAFDDSDFIFDFTMGDSFSDIYGSKRFFTGTILKWLACKSKGCFVLGPQTYGPFKRSFAKKFAGIVIKNADYIFTRDEMSQAYIKELFEIEPELTTDVAFALPFSKQNLENDKIKVGINVSGLLWQGGYNQNNQFGLTVDYQRYIKELLDTLTANDKYQVYIIPHVVSHSNAIDSDTMICKELSDKYSNVVGCSDISSCIEAKNIISGMDVFTGARMHATIAAFSSGVAVIPFSYSRKFEGLFESLNYGYVISAANITEEEALRKTLDYIDSYTILRDNVNESMKEVYKKQNDFRKRLGEIIVNK